MTCCDVVCSSLHDDTTHTGQELLWDWMSPDLMELENLQNELEIVKVHSDNKVGPMQNKINRYIFICNEKDVMMEFLLE